MRICIQGERKHKISILPIFDQGYNFKQNKLMILYMSNNSFKYKQKNNNKEEIEQRHVEGELNTALPVFQGIP